MLAWDLTILENTIGNKDSGEVIPRTGLHSFFSRKKSEIQKAFTFFFQKWKVKNKIPSLFFEKWNSNGSRSRTRSENEKILENSRETRISLVSVFSSERAKKLLGKYRGRWLGSQRTMIESIWHFYSFDKHDGAKFRIFVSFNIVQCT